MPRKSQPIVNDLEVGNRILFTQALIEESPPAERRMTVEVLAKFGGSVYCSVFAEIHRKRRVEPIVPDDELNNRLARLSLGSVLAVVEVDRIDRSMPVDVAEWDWNLPITEDGLISAKWEPRLLTYTDIQGPTIAR